MFDIVILGAGAAGLMCALTAGRRGRRVLVLDHARQPGEKILISGGGRCNFTNIHCTAANFFSQNPHFARSALTRYTPAAFLALVERHKIAWHEKTLGQLFCDNSARDIVMMLLAECSAGPVEIRLNQKVGGISKSGHFTVDTSAGPVTAASLVLATGGLSIPKIGATGLAYRIAEQFGLAIIPPRPGLVPLTLDANDLGKIDGLAGVSTSIIAECRGRKFRDGMVITHHGLSGPAILQISSVWQPADAITLNLTPDTPAGVLVARKKSHPRAGLHAALNELMPSRLAASLMPADLVSKPIADIPDKTLHLVENTLRAWRITPSGTQGYAKAEVTLGGIDTACLNQRTLQATHVPGLFAIGEAVDVTGWLGGYNFQWAWASGFCAGEHA